MKVAFPTPGCDLEAPLDRRFGRASGFLIYDLERGTFEVVDNLRNQDKARETGVQAAETLVGQGVKNVVTGHCCKKAFRVLSASGVRVFLTDATTVADALARLRSGRLVESRSADDEGDRA